MKRNAEMNAQLAKDQAFVEQALTQYADRWPAYGELQKAMAYSLLSGGKRIRPVLTLAVCRLFGGKEEQALPFACGLEMIHTYSLIHDDLPCMDDDDFRRGRPTNHKVFGEATAVLAGDALLTAAFETLTQAPVSPTQISRGVACLARLAGPAGMVGGQVLDLWGEGKQLDYDEILQLQSLKTGCLLEAAARLGAIAANSTQEQEEAAAQYARKLGLAFQIRDDLLDVLGEEATFGKPIGSDRENQKSTFVQCKGIDNCKHLVHTLTEEAVAALSDYPGSQFLQELARMLEERVK